MRSHILAPRRAGSALLLAAASLVIVHHGALAQSTRERAVAIDRVPVAPPDLMQVERIGPGMKSPWSIAILTDGRMLVTEKHGQVMLIDRTGAANAVPGGPGNVLQKSDSGLLDIALDPDFATNRFVYIAFAEGTEAANRTALWKGRFDSHGFTDGRVIFRVGEAKKDVAHPGGRLLFLPDKTLLLTVGDGYDLKDKAQDPASHLGKVLRLTRDGVAARDNPFTGRPGHAPEVWTIGHRNIQGLTLDPATGAVWSHEHGPRGGDEINRLEAGRNYGWPALTNGIDYDGKLISERAHAPDMQSPQFIWAPSIAPSGLAIYRGSLFSELEGRLLVGGLASRSVSQVRVHPTTGLLAEEARLLTGLRLRVRDIRVAPDGNIFFLSDEDGGGLYRILPRAEQPLAPPAGHERSLRDLGFLIGSWTGNAEFRAPTTPRPEPRAEASRTLCQSELRGNFIKCETTFARPNGRSRTIQKFFNYDPDIRRFRVQILNNNWGGLSHYEMDWNDEEKAWVGLIPTTDPQNRPATERVVMRPSADRRQIDHSEALRINGTEEWIPTFRWTYKKN